MAKEEHEMPQSESDVESESGEENRESDKSDNESKYDDNEDDDNEDDGEPEKPTCNHCGEETGHIVYLMYSAQDVPKMFMERFLLGQRRSMYDM
jgi:DNA-directed RNA polymerase subunit M/transcription elongation factor TFIIS